MDYEGVVNFLNKNKFDLFVQAITNTVLCIYCSSPYVLIPIAIFSYFCIKI